MTESTAGYGVRLYMMGREYHSAYTYPDVLSAIRWANEMASAIKSQVEEGPVEVEISLGELYDIKQA